MAVPILDRNVLAEKLPEAQLTCNMDNPSILNLKPVRHPRLSKDIATQVERLILARELHVGEMLPAERKLAAQLGVSRNILREAISMLVQKGLLEVRSGSGTVVVSPSVEFLRDSISAFVQFSADSLLDLLEARRSIEVEIAGLAAHRATEDDCRLLTTYLEAMETAVRESEPHIGAYIEADIRFHAALALAGKNEILQLLLDSIRGAMRESIQVALNRNPAANEIAMVYHRRIARAVIEHSPEEARMAMREHLEAVQRTLKESEASLGNLGPSEGMRTVEERTK